MKLSLFVTQADGCSGKHPTGVGVPVEVKDDNCTRTCLDLALETVIRNRHSRSRRSLQEIHMATGVARHDGHFISLTL